METHREAGTQRADALDLLTVDHRRVRRLFRQFAKCQSPGATQAGIRDPGDIVDEICAELTLHAQVEDEIFYPAARHLSDLADALDEAEVEHAAVAQLVGQLSAMTPGDELYDARVTVLGEYVQHHIREEERRIFPRVRAAGLDLVGMAREIRKRLRDLRLEMGLLDDEVPEAAMAGIGAGELPEPGPKPSPDPEQHWIGGKPEPERRVGGIGADADHDDDYTDEDGGVVGGAGEAERPASPH